MSSTKVTSSHRWLQVACSGREISATLSRETRKLSGCVLTWTGHLHLAGVGSSTCPMFLNSIPGVSSFLKRCGPNVRGITCSSILHIHNTVYKYILFAFSQNKKSWRNGSAAASRLALLPLGSRKRRRANLWWEELTRRCVAGSNLLSQHSNWRVVGSLQHQRVVVF